MDSVRLEMKNVRMVFEEYEGETKKLIGYQRINCHIIFDIKYSDTFRRKVRYLAGWHRTRTPALVTNSSVIPKDSMRIALLILGLNQLDILSGDI